MLPDGELVSSGSKMRCDDLEMAANETVYKGLRSAVQCKCLGENRCLKRKLANTGVRAKKIPTDKSWDFALWWRRRESNPRPQVLYRQFYILSAVIYLT